MKVAKVTYQRSISPEGKIQVFRPSHGTMSHLLTDYKAAIDIQKVGNDAWTKSEWLDEVARHNNIPTDELIKRAFDPDNEEMALAQYRRIARSTVQGRKIVYWLGHISKPTPAGLLDDPEAQLASDPSTPIHPNGFIKIEQQGLIQVRGLQRIQRAAGIGVYSCIHDLNVASGEQGNGLGTVLAYVGLSDQPPYLKTSLHTAATNAPMRAWAHKYDFYVTNEYEDTDLFPGISVPFVRYEHESNAKLLATMEQADPWLANGQVSSLQDVIQEKLRTMR